MVYKTIENKKGGIKILKRPITIILTFFVFIFSTTFAFAEEKRETCEMTIESSQHDVGMKPAEATGACKGLVFGTYTSELDQFMVEGMVNYIVEYSGQTFNVSSPHLAYPAILTVYTIRNDKPKTEQPKTEKPKTEQPKTEKRKTETTKTEKTKTEQSKTEKSKTEQPKQSNSNSKTTTNSNATNQKSTNITNSNTSTKKDVEVNQSSTKDTVEISTNDSNHKDVNAKTENENNDMKELNNSIEVEIHDDQSTNLRKIDEVQQDKSINEQDKRENNHGISPKTYIYVGGILLIILGTFILYIRRKK